MAQQFNFYNEKKKVKNYKVKPSMVSRLAITSKTIYEGVPAWNIYSWIDYEFFIENWTSHIVKETDRLDIIAKKYYGNVKFWWILVLFNADISLDPYELEKTGIELKIPSYDEITDFIDTFRK